MAATTNKATGVHNKLTYTHETHTCPEIPNPWVFNLSRTDIHSRVEYKTRANLSKEPMCVMM